MSDTAAEGQGRSPGVPVIARVALVLTVLVCAGALYLIAVRGESLLIDLAGMVRALCL